MKQLLRECAEWLSEHPDNEKARELLDKIQAKLRFEEGYFIISVVSRDDLISQGYDGNAVDDETMKNIASSMSKAHTEYGEYWLSLSNACMNADVPQLGKE